MGFIFRKQIGTSKNTHLNVSKSGVSESARVGPVTISSRGTGRIRIVPGLSFRFGRRRAGNRTWSRRGLAGHQFDLDALEESTVLSWGRPGRFVSNIG
jgi:hypothetical protein